MTLITKKAIPKGLNAGGIAALEEVRSSLNHLANALHGVHSSDAFGYWAEQLVLVWEDSLEAARLNEKLVVKKGGRK